MRRRALTGTPFIVVGTTSGKSKTERMKLNPMGGRADPRDGCLFGDE